MTRRWTVALLLGLGLAGPTAAARLPKMTLPLVQAQCESTPPGPCQPAFAFRDGTAVLTTAKEPAPTCPKTGKPSETPGGRVTMAGVTRNGAPYAGSLVVEVTNQTTFGSDGGVCALNGLQITTSTLVGTLTCRGGKCKGPLLPFACLPADCTRAPITTELRLLEVLDAPTIEGGKAIARPGLFVAPAK